MNVQNRKLFVDRGARNRLAEMSGVMASSESLLGEVQKFADGGMAMPRGVPDSPRLSESMVPRVPIANIGGQNFFISEDGNSIVDERGSVVRDPNILNAVMQQILPPTQPQEEGGDAGMPFTRMGGEDRGGRTDAEILAEARAMIADRRTPESADFLPAGFNSPELMPTENEVPAQPSPTMQDIMDARSVAENQGGPMGESSAMLAEMTAGKPEGIMATISALATATDDEKTAILFPDGNRGVPVPISNSGDDTSSMAMPGGVPDSPRLSEISGLGSSLLDVLSPGVQQTYETPQMTGLEEFQQSQPISKEVSDQMRVLDMAKRGASISEMSKASGIGLLELTNILAGSASLLVTEGAALAGDVASLITGGGDVSKALSRTSQDLRDFGRNAYLPESATDVNNIDQSAGILNFAPRLIDTSGPTPVELESERLAQIEAESLRIDALLAGNEALSAEGAPVESLGGNFPDSIIEARITESPETPRFSSAGDGPQSVSSPQMTNEELGLDGIVDEMAVESARRTPSLPGYDTSTGGAPLTMDEVSESVLTEREQAAAAGLTNTQEQEDRFPQEAARIAAQDAALSEIRTRRLSDQEREQMTLGSNTGTGLTVENAAAEVPSVVTNEGGLKSSLRPQLRPDRTDEEIQDELAGISGGKGSATEKSGAFANTLLGTEGLGPKDTVKAYEAKFNEMLGVEDKDKSKEMWNNMAMIGFAIAAGESPNALQNIANGMLAGTKMMKDDKAAAQARQDKVSMLAMSEANEDRRLDARLRSAERIAGMRSSGGGSNYSSERERSRLKELIYKDPFEFPSLMGEGGSLDPELVNEYLNEAVGSADPTVPKTKPLTMQETEEAAKAAGDPEFTFNGNRYPVR